MASEMVSIPADAIPDLRKALNRGLFAIAEVERSREYFELAEMAGPIPDLLKEARPVCCMASIGDMSEYAEALLWLDHATPVA